MESKIIRKNEIFLLEVDGKTMPMYGYMSYQPEKACYEDFKNAGVHLFFTAVYAGDRGINQNSGIRPFRRGFWKGYDSYDFSVAERDFRRILGDSRPGENYLIPRLMVEPPSWWEDENPGELCLDAQGTPVHHSYCSEKWKKDTEHMMEAFRDWLDESGFAAYVPGWHIACGNTEEFLRPNHHPMQYTDYSPCALRAFRQWLKQRYGNAESLNRVWHTSYASFDDAQFATPAQRMFGSAAGGALHDPAFEQRAIDTYAFLNEVNAQAVVDLCAAAKRVTGGKQVIGAFFGYSTAGTEEGHHAAHIVFKSNAVDFLASPFMYTDNRAAGVDWGFPGSVESAMLHGKPWFMEADVRTCLSEPISKCMPHADPVVNRAYDGPVWLGPDTVEGSLGQMTKALARVLTHNTAVWWFDMWGGWYDHDEFRAFHRKAREIYEEYTAAGGSKNAAPAAVFLDDAFFHRISPIEGYAWMYHELCRQLGYTGTPYRLYLLDDFAKVDPADYRLALFGPVAEWTPETLDALKKWRADGRMLVFLDALNTDTSAASGILSVETGLERLPGDAQIVSDAAERTVSILRRHAEYSVYCTAERTPPADLLRRLILAAGGQIYTFGGDVVYASEKYLAVHAASDGVKRICVPYKANLADVFTGEILPGNESFAEAEMKKGETLLLRINKK